MDNWTIRSILGTLTWISFFAAIIISFYFYLRYRNKERMALIEKGVDVSEIFKPREITFKFPWLRVAMLLIGIGAGILFTYIFIAFIAPNLTEPRHQLDQMILIFSLLIFGGVSIVIGNYLEGKRNKKNG
jgi:hypothetical protein